MIAFSGPGVPLPVRVQRVGDGVWVHVSRLQEHPLQRQEAGVIGRDAAVHLDPVAGRQDDHLVEAVEVRGVVVRLRQVGVVERQELQELDRRPTERHSQAEDPHGWVW